MSQKVVVTGGAGFIGSHLVDRLLAEGHTVTLVDNFSSGRREFLNQAWDSPRLRVIEMDLQDLKPVTQIFEQERPDLVYHFAANADVRFGLDHPRRDLEQNTIVTWNVLEGTRRCGAKSFAFTSTGSVYGEAPVIPTPETCPFPIQTSLYGASKLSGEAMISAYAEGFGIRATVFRFVSILGPRYTHGHIFDFLKSLRQDPTRLRVLGNGTQRKSYLHVSDCIEAVIHTTLRKPPQKFEIYNLGTDEYVTVNDSIQVICDELQVKPHLDYTGGDRGWVGDNPFIFLDCSKLRATGWAPKWTIRDAVRDTVKYLSNESWVLEARA